MNVVICSFLPFLLLIYLPTPEPKEDVSGKTGVRRRFLSHAARERVLALALLATDPRVLTSSAATTSSLPSP